MFRCDDLYIVTNMSAEHSASLVGGGLLDPVGEDRTNV